MNAKHSEKQWMFIILLATLLTILFSGLALVPVLVFGAPTGANIINNVTETIAPSSAASLTTAGGSFTTLILNGSYQTQSWKAYVGNVSGVLTLDDATSNTIYDWNLASASGEVYVSRNASVDWSTISCANSTVVSQEQSALNINSSSVDSINNTFNETIHKSFYVGTINIPNSSCYSIDTYINDAKQAPSETADFQEVLLQSNNNLIYSTILENSVAGFDNGEYDFQLIIPEDETKPTPTTYYFYVEIS